MNRSKRYQETNLYKRFTFMHYEIGKDKRKCWVKLPKNSYRIKVSMARRYLLFNYACSRIITTCKPNMTAEEWNKQFEQQKALTFRKRYGANGMHRRLARRTKRDPKELTENRKAYGIQECDTNRCTETDTDSEDASQMNDVEQTDEWRCKNWLKPMRKDYLSIEINEIISNMRMVGKSWDKSNIIPPITAILLESLRSGIFSQDWRVVAKSLEGIFEEAVRTAHSQHPIVWNGGFLSLLRFTKNDKEHIKEYARTCKGTFRPKAYGRRLGCEVAIWLAQEGFFNESILFLEEMEINTTRGAYYTHSKFRLPFNPKRDLIDLMANLIKAVFLYSVWRKDSIAVAEGIYRGSTQDLRRTGENALSAFESLLELAQDCESDVTTFLEPLIELTLKYRSTERAKEIFKELVIRHHGNAFVEGAYLTFLQKHFPQLGSEINARIELSKKFLFESAYHQQQNRKIAAYREQRKKEMPEKACLKKIPNPQYSW